MEDEIGRIKFVFFYLLSGVAGAATHIALNAQSTIPMVGASGAISGVLGAYLVLHPSARVKMLFIIRFIRIPAWCYLLIWIGLESPRAVAGQQGGEHGRGLLGTSGGFVAGMFPLNFRDATAASLKDF